MAHAQFTLDVRTGPVTQKPGEFEILPQKGSKGVVVQAPAKSSLVRGILESSDDEDEDDVDMKDSVPFTAEEIRKMNQAKLRAHCVTYSLKQGTVPKMKEALMKKFGLEGSVLSDRDLRIEESSNAMAAFLKLANVLAITSRIPGFNHKNKAHAKAFMEQYREQNGKGTTRSRK